MPKQIPPTRTVAIDLTQIPLKKTGVGVYALNLVRELLEHRDTLPDIEYIFFIKSHDPELARLLSQYDCEVVKVPKFYFAFIGLRIFFEQVVLPFQCFSRRVDLLHSLHYTTPILAPFKQVVTYHDMLYYDWADVIPRVRRYVFRFFMFFSIRLAGRILCVSQSTRRDLKHRFQSMPDYKFGVTPLGFTPPAQKALAKNIPQAFGLKPQSYFMFLGTVEPRKNLPRLVQAFSEIHRKHPGLKLAIVGGQGWMHTELYQTLSGLELEDAVVFTGFVSEEEKAALLIGSLAMIYPSLYEGFGLPILEAMALGTPVITSNTASMPEVAGEAAILIQPSLVESIEDGLEQMLDAGVRKKYKKLGLKQVHKFPWRNTATSTYQAYMDLLAEE